MDHLQERSDRLRVRRADFPALRRTLRNQPLAYLDGPAGTQVPRRVIEAISRYYRRHNANTHGQFLTSRESDDLIETARATVATFLGAPGSHTISFGANMTTLCFSLSKAIARRLRPGDEILVTQLDHEANRGPWLTLRDQGIVVKEIGVLPDASLDYGDFRNKVNERTRLVAMGMASNAFGTVNDFAMARDITYRVGAWLLLDAVHYAPHFPIDVSASGVDFLFCSAYKFYGPHVGILYAKEGMLEQFQTDSLRTQDPRAPTRIETGTLNHAALAGVKAAIEYIAALGAGSDMRAKLVSAMTLLAAHEHHLATKLYAGLRAIRGVTVFGQTFELTHRAPTVSFMVSGKTAGQVCSGLAEKGVCVWDGHFYAIRPAEVLGLLEHGGVTRAGISLYNTEEEVERLLAGVESLAPPREAIHPQAPEVPSEFEDA
jgi:cysteine desulfurase family protein (TIGR01976 family)